MARTREEKEAFWRGYWLGMTIEFVTVVLVLLFLV
jgi:hypothetical protein